LKISKAHISGHLQFTGRIQDPLREPLGGKCPWSNHCPERPGEYLLFLYRKSKKVNRKCQPDFHDTGQFDEKTNVYRRVGRKHLPEELSRQGF
jgi:hypothetical protein